LPTGCAEGREEEALCLHMSLSARLHLTLSGCYARIGISADSARK